MKLSPQAGKLADPSLLIDVSQLIEAYYSHVPDPSIAEQKVSFGTSGHRGCSLNGSFNEGHILAISQAIFEYRRLQGIDGPLFLGIDTHALSEPARISALEVLLANRVDVVLAQDDEFTPTPVISHAILTYNRGRIEGLADGIVITPSHNPPSEGGFKYNPPHGGPADTVVTKWIEARANILLKAITDVPRIDAAKGSRSVRRAPFLRSYVDDLIHVIDMEMIRSSGIRIGVDPLGGAGVHYWEPIAEKYALNITVVNKVVDPTFRFMTLDWDGKIRMDPSSPYAMHSLIGLKEKFDIAFACDTDHDRHGIVAPSGGLLPPNHYLCASVFYLFQHRPQWKKELAVGKTVVSSGMIDRVAKRLGRKIYEVPVGFKWFVEGLYDGSLGFGGEESAGSTFLRKEGAVWTTDKDGMVAALLSAEMTARMKKDPAEIYLDLTKEFGLSYFERIDARANSQQREKLKQLTPSAISSNLLAGEPIEGILTKAPGNEAPIEGLKVVTKNGWFAARPSGTEDIYKIYAESFRSPEHLHKILEEAQTIVNTALGVH